MPDRLDLYRSNLTDVHESQALFRLLLDSLSRPGSIFELPQWVGTRTIPALVPLIALVSHDVPFAIVGASDTGLDEAIARATAGRLAPVRDAAYVALLGPASSDLSEIKMGSPQRPDHAAQVGLQVNGSMAQSAAADATFSLRGPGVAGVRHVRFEGDTDSVRLLDSVLAVRPAQPPCGFDLWIFDTSGHVIGVPRTSLVTRSDQEEA
jgi:alpha-D-ribose 1-methylphosphonate 5-triphosphate synthase subunit PhnH